MQYICLTRDINKVISSIGERSPGRSFSWVFFGDDQAATKAVSSAWGEANRVKTGLAFHEIAKKIRPSYLQLIARLNEINRDSLLWWASGLASKSPFLSQFYKLLCYKHLAKDLIKNNENIVILVEDRYLFDLLKTNPAWRRSTFIGGPGPDRWTSILRSILVRTYLGLAVIWQKIRMSKTSKLDLSIPSLLLFSWVQPRSYDANLKFIDHYTYDLKQYLEKRSEKVQRFSFALLSNRMLLKAARAKEQIVFHLKYLTVTELLKAICSRFHFGYDGQAQFEGDDISRLFEREIDLEDQNKSFINALLFYQAMRNIVRQAKSVKKIVYIYEGQPWEKMLILAARKENPGIKLFGYQHSSFADLYLCVFPASAQDDLTPLPDKILANSDLNRKRLIENGIREEMVSSVGALNYGYLFAADKREKLPGTVKGSVLISLPYNQKLAYEMLECVAPVLAKLNKKGLVKELKIKPHPLVTINFSQIDKIADLMAWAKVVGGSVDEALSGIETVIFCNGTVGVESLSAGKTVIKYLPQLELDLDPCAGTELEKQIATCYGSDDFESIMLKILDQGTPKTSVGQGTSLLDPVNYRSLDLALDLAEKGKS